MCRTGIAASSSWLTTRSKKRNSSAWPKTAAPTASLGLRLVDRAAVRAREPHIEAAAALEVPSTGIISAEDLIKTLARMATDQGASLLTRTRVVRLDPRADSIAVTLVEGDAGEGAEHSEETIEARCVINCAGLYADEIAAMLGNRDYRIYPVRGEYCELVRAKSHLINNLVYPLPHADGLSLGVHLTRTLWDTVLVGPTADYVADKNDYERNRLPIEEFVRRAKSMLPEIEAADLQLAYSGIRAKLVPPGHAGIADFVIARDANVPRAIQLIGIESPGPHLKPGHRRSRSCRSRRISSNSLLQSLCFNAEMRGRWKHPAAAQHPARADRPE